MFAEIWPWAFGSGKLGTPFLRMHDANLVSCWTLPPTIDIAPPLPPVAEPELPTAPPPVSTPGAPLAVLLVDVDVVPRLATDGAFAPPPHPATASPSTATPPASATVRGCRTK
jgi:hypothetical protein